MFTMYGLVAALAGWASGVLVENVRCRTYHAYQRRRAARRVVLHLLFVGVALPSGVYPLMLGVYALRGVAVHPLFVVLMAQTIDPAKLASAMGWFWAAYSFGIGVFWRILPSFTIPMVGEYYSLWLFVAVFYSWTADLPADGAEKQRVLDASSMSNADKLRELSRGVTILVHNRQIALAAVVRVICNPDVVWRIPVIMPLYLATTNNWRRRLVLGFAMESDLGIPVVVVTQCNVLGSYGRFAWLDAANALVWLLVL